MIKLENYWLRAIEKKDLRWMASLRNDPSTWENLGHFGFINDVRQKRWLESVSARTDVEYLIFGFQKTNLGIVRITDIDRTNLSICVGGDIIPRHRGKGHAKMMYQLIFKLGFDTWNMHRLWLLVLATNRIGVNLYKKIGFAIEGKQRQAIYRNGKYIDYISMSILRNEYQKIKKQWFKN